MCVCVCARIRIYDRFPIGTRNGKFIVNRRVRDWKSIPSFSALCAGFVMNFQNFCETLLSKRKKENMHIYTIDACKWPRFDDSRTVFSRNEIYIYTLAARRKAHLHLCLESDADAIKSRAYNLRP